MNIIEAATALKNGKRVFEPRLGWQVYIDSRDNLLSYRFSGEPAHLSIKDVLSEKWAVVNE